jgi:hypothetical protein
MRGILEDKKRRMDKKGQVLIINLIFLVMTIVVFVAMIPVLREALDNTRHENALNCKSNMNKCEISAGVPCYNSSKNSETVGCAMIDLYIPYIVIVVLIAGVAKLMANRVESFVGPQQSAYPGY